jgi:hypothetical protein
LSTAFPPLSSFAYLRVNQQQFGGGGVCDLVRCRHSPCWRRAAPSSRYVKSKVLINPCVLIRLHGHQLALQPCNDSSPVIFIESEGGGQGMDKKCRRLDAPSRSVVRACRGPESYRPLPFGQKRFDHSMRLCPPVTPSVASGVASLCSSRLALVPFCLLLPCRLSIQGSRSEYIYIYSPENVDSSS